MSQGRFKQDRADHPDVKTRDVIVHAPNGEWLKFDTLLDAKVIMLPEHHVRIFTGLEDFENRATSYQKQDLIQAFETQSIPEIWNRLQLHARNPMRKQEAMAAADASAKGNGKRVRRPRVLKYRFNLDARNSQTAVDTYYRLPPQARAIIDLIEELVKPLNEPVIMELELKQFIEKNREKLDTRQDPWRIFQYYRGRLIASGFLRFTR